MTKKIIDGSELADMKFEIQEDGTLKQIVKGKFVPRHGEKYYYIGIYGLIKCDDAGDHWLFNHQLVFRTKKECEEYRNFLDLLDEYTFEPDWNNSYQTKWFIYYDHNGKKIIIGHLWSAQTTAIWFKSEEIAEEFIEKVGEKNIKQFMFDVWE